MMATTAPTPVDNAPVPLATPPPPARPAHQQHHARLSNARRSISQLSQMNAVSSGEGTTAAAIPTPNQPHGQQAMGQPGQFDTSKSPPGSKNLNHVPCKFFRQGACQAGKACPFSHNIDSTTDTAPCKYFSKGNCKFGQKCALAHILPDGRRVNRPHHSNGHGHMQFGRMDTGFTNHRSALHNSLMQANVGNGHHTPNQSIGGQDDFPPLSGQPIPHQMEQPLSSSLSDAQFGGSPRNADGFQMSPLASSHRTLGPLDATLPASIDRYDYSYFAKHGPFASSVPNTFGVDSPPPSLPNSIRGETTVSALRRSVFGDDETGSPSGELSRSAHLREGSFSERILHSSANRRPPPKVYSSSYAGPQNMMGGFGSHGPNGFRDDKSADFADDHFAFEEDFVPESLSDLLTPAERNRRMSRTDEDAGANFRNGLSNSHTPNNDVFGSPPVGSPNSWGPLINRQRRDEDHTIVSSVGHVGSPLRNTYLHSDSSPALRSLNRPGEISPFTNSPTGRGGGISALTQSLKFSKLSDEQGSQPKPIARAVSSPRLQNGKSVEPIDEEAECQFNLEVEEDGPTKLTGGFTSPGVGPSGLGLRDQFFTSRS